MDEWQQLTGGYMNSVHRRGDVVRRELGTASPAVHDLLKHLESRDIPLVSRLLDDDEKYEYLTLLPGTPCFRPWPREVGGDGVGWLTDLGLWLRSYHDAVQGFRVHTPTFLWGPREPTADMLVCHGDLGPWNLLQTDGRLKGVIDWDLARYGNPLDDLAQLALEAIPLTGRHDETLGTAADHSVIDSRLGTLCAAYGVAPDIVLHHLPIYLRMTLSDVRALAQSGKSPFVSFERTGYVKKLEADLETVSKTWS